MKHALLFPGQGAQFVGMGKKLAATFTAARETFQEADESLSEKLTALVFDGADRELRQTRNAQPALMTLSIAVLRVLKQEFSLDWNKIAPVVAGHSLGEYSALAAAEVLPFAQCIRLLRLRGEAMQSAVAEGKGAMAALLGLSLKQARLVAQNAAAETNECCVVANDNAVGQVVVSGDKDAVEKATLLAKEAGAKRSVMLEVSAPFHSPLMKPAEEVMRKALAEIPFQKARFPVVCNVTAELEQNGDALRELLVLQICSSVRWRESLLKLASLEVERFWELGAGRALSGMVKRTVEGGQGFPVLTTQELEAAAKAMT